jgi:Protein of unknown function (DUF1353)
VSSFTAPLRFEATDDFRRGRRLYRTQRDLIYFVGDEGSPLVVTVPAGFATDLASVPAFGRFWFLPDGPWAPAAVVHDWLLAEGLVSRRMADLIFYEATGVLGVPLARRLVLYVAVRLGALSRTMRLGRKDCPTARRAPIDPDAR